MFSGGFWNKGEEKYVDEINSVEIPIDGTLDLHTFSPRDVGDLVPEYLAQCRQKGIYRVRVIHGKGTGTLRKTVQSILGKIPWVTKFNTANMDDGGWGATIVYLSGEDQLGEDGSAEDRP